jgi:hypothetical protein
MYILAIKSSRNSDRKKKLKNKLITVMPNKKINEIFEQIYNVLVFGNFFCNTYNERTMIKGEIISPPTNTINLPIDTPYQYKNFY